MIQDHFITNQTLSLKREPHFWTKFNLFLFLFFFLLNSPALGYDFSDIKGAVEHDLGLHNISADSMRVATVFDVEQHETVKEQVNLVKLKKEFAKEMLKVFQVVDPIVVNDIFILNEIDKKSLKDDLDVLGQFLDRTGATHLQYVTITSRGEDLLLTSELMDGNQEMISFTRKIITPEPKEVLKGDNDFPDQTTEGNEIPAEKDSEPRNAGSAEDSGPGFFDSLLSSFEGSKFLENHNDSWMHFSPTAYLSPRQNSFDLSLWFKDVVDTDIRFRHARYGYRLGPVQFGAQAYTTTDSDDKTVAHSAYGTLRFHAIDESTGSPIDFTLGARGRAYWNDDNTDFNHSDETVKEKNLERDQISVIGILSTKIDKLGLMLNLYVDNQHIGGGAKFLVTSHLKLFVEGVYNNYESDQKYDGDYAFGAIVSTDNQAEIGLTYQGRSEQTLVHIKVDL